MTLAAQSALDLALRSMERDSGCTVVSVAPGGGALTIVAYATALACRFGDSSLILASDVSHAQTLLRCIEDEFPRCLPLLLSGDRLRSDRTAALRDLRLAHKAGRPVIACVEDLARHSLGATIGIEPVFDWMIVDRAWMLADARFALLSPLAKRFVFVGTPSDVAAPSAIGETYKSAPQAMVERSWVEACVIELRQSSRIPDDTASLLSDSLFESFRFTGVSDYPHRALNIAEGFSLADGIDSAILLSSCGSTITGLELPQSVVYGPRDQGIMFAAVSLARRLLDSGSQIVMYGKERPLAAKDVAIIVPREFDADGVRTALDARDRGVDVWTASACQCRQRPITIVLAPLATTARARDVDAHVRDLRAMLTRHQVACFVVHRPGEAAPPFVDRTLTVETRVVFDAAWAQHTRFFQALHHSKRSARIGSLR